jgi:hypothetical protein
MADDRRDDDWPDPISTDEQLERARRAFRDTFELRRRVLRYAYLVLGLLIVLVIVLAVTR